MQLAWPSPSWTNGVTGRVYQPWVRLVLLPTMMSFKVAGLELGQRKHIGSSPYLRLRFAGEFRTSGSADSKACSINLPLPQLFQLNLPLFHPSHVIHCPCYACATACAHPTHVLDHQLSPLKRGGPAPSWYTGTLVTRPRPLIPSCTWVTISLCRVCLLEWGCWI